MPALPPPRRDIGNREGARSPGFCQATVSLDGRSRRPSRPTFLWLQERIIGGTGDRCGRADRAAGAFERDAPCVDPLHGRRFAALPRRDGRRRRV